MAWADAYVSWLKFHFTEAGYRGTELLLHPQGCSKEQKILLNWVSPLNIRFKSTHSARFNFYITAVRAMIMYMHI